MSPSGQAPREGALIRVARKARGLTAKEAARATPIRLGESRWYHIEAGHESKGSPVVAPPDTLAHMAHVVGVTPQQLKEVGRKDAAEILEMIIHQEDVARAHEAHAAEMQARSSSWEARIRAIDDLTAQEQEACITLVKALRGQSRPQASTGEDDTQRRHRTG